MKEIRCTIHVHAFMCILNLIYIMSYISYKMMEKIKCIKHASMCINNLIYIIWLQALSMNFLTKFVKRHALSFTHFLIRTLLANHRRL